MKSLLYLKRFSIVCSTWRFASVKSHLYLVVLAMGLFPDLGVAQVNGSTQSLAEAILSDDVDGSRAALAAGADITAVIADPDQPEISFTFPLLAVASGSSQVVPALLDVGASREEFLALAPLACGLQSATITWYLEQAEFDPSMCLVEAIADAEPGVRYLFQNLASLAVTGQPAQSATAPVGMDDLENFTLEDLARRTPAIGETDALVRFVNILLDGGADPEKSVPVEGTMAVYGRPTPELDAREAAAFFGEQFVFSLLSDVSQPNFQALRVDLLVGCARFANTACVKALLDDGVSANGADAVGSFALAAAALVNEGDALSQLLDAGADPNLYGPLQEPPIIAVTQANIVSGIHLLAKAGANLNTVIDREWPLRIATKAAEVDTARALLDNGADPNLRLSNGTSVLHSLDEELTLRGAKRILKPAHGPLARMLFDAGYQDDPQAPVLESYGTRKDFSLWFVEELISLGAEVPLALLHDAVREKRTPWIDLFFSDGTGIDAQNPNMPYFFRDLLNNKEFDRARDLLRFGMAPPPDPYAQAQDLLLAFADNAALVRPMLAAGYQATYDTAREDFYKILIEGGHGALVPEFIAAGLPADDPIDGSGPGLIHRVLRGDIATASVDQKRAFAAFVAAGASLTRQDAQGRTPENIAQSQPQLYADYLQLLDVLGAESTTPPLHRAVYARDIRLLRRTLAADPSQLNLQNADGLTALNLALRLGDTLAANSLLAAGAEIGIEKVDGLSDVDFAHHPNLARQFRLRLLQKVITRLETGAYLHDAQARLDAFDARLSVLPAIEWTVECGGFCIGTRIYTANDSSGFLKTQASRTGNRLNYEMTLQSGEMVRDLKACTGSGCRGSGKIEYTISGSVKLDKCEDPLNWPEVLCYAEIIVDPINWRGSQVVVIQDGAETVYTGEPIRVDRTNGPVEILRAPARAKGFPNQFSLEIDVGPQSDLPAIISQAVNPPDPAGFGLPQRMAIYAQLYRWTLEGEALDAEQTREGIMRFKTLLTARELVSLRLASGGHRLVVDTELKTYAGQMLLLDRSTTALRDLVVASSTISPQQFTALKLRLTQLRDAYDATSREWKSLNQIIAVLEQTAIGTDAFHAALTTFEREFLTLADDVIINYQGALLESAQLYSLAEIEKNLALSQAQRTTIAGKLLPSDIRISKQALEGRGAKLREVAGLEVVQ